MTIEWKESYQLGHPALDAHHQHLFDLARQIMAARQVTEIQWLVEDLYRHTRLHFEEEEAEMRRCKYPGVAAHTESHNRLLSRLNTLSAGIGQGRLDKAALDALMTDWALFHIPLDDARFGAFLQSLAAPGAA